MALAQDVDEYPVFAATQLSSSFGFLSITGICVRQCVRVCALNWNGNETDHYLNSWLRVESCLCVCARLERSSPPALSSLLPSLPPQNHGMSRNNI